MARTPHILALVHLARFGFGQNFVIPCEIQVYFGAICRVT